MSCQVQAFQDKYEIILLTLLQQIPILLCVWSWGQPFGQAHSSERVRLGFGTKLLAMDVVDAEGLDDEAVGEERTEGKLIQFVMSYFLSSNSRVNFPFKDLLKICSVLSTNAYRLYLDLFSLSTVN